MASRDLDPRVQASSAESPPVWVHLRSCSVGPRRCPASWRHGGRFCPVPQGICLVCMFLKQPQCAGMGVVARGVLGAGVSGWPLVGPCVLGEGEGDGWGNGAGSSEALERGRVPGPLSTSCSWKGKSHPPSVPCGGALSRALGSCCLSPACSSSGPWALQGEGRGAPPLVSSCAPRAGSGRAAPQPSSLRRLRLPTRSCSGDALVLGRPCPG